MAAMGILDLTKVNRYVQQNAASVAGLMIITEAMIVDKSKAESAGGIQDYAWHGGNDVVGISWTPSAAKEKAPKITGLLWVDQLYRACM